MNVSIITPTNLNISGRTIDSIVNQTSKDFEWIIVVDGSFEGGRGKGFFYSESFPKDKAKFAMLDNNYGPSTARNVGFQLSDGDVITYLDNDDELEPDRIEKIIEYFSDFDIEMMFSSYKIVQPNRPTITFSHFNYFGEGKMYYDVRSYLNNLRKQNIAIPLGVAHRRRPFVEAGGFQRGIVCGEDGILWRRMVDKTPISKILFEDSLAGTYHVNLYGQSRLQPRFEQGGFSFDGRREDNGKYLDEDWYKNYNSVNLFDNRLEINE
jgi:glycosyltransferase involved in cell wall biosynthesis